MNSCNNCGAPWMEPAQFCGRCGQHRQDATARTESSATVAPTDQAATRSSRSRVSRKRMIGVVVAALALVLVASVAWRFLGPHRGASSPEQAVDQFLTSLASQDLLGAAKVLNPAEADAIGELYQAGQERLKKEHITDGNHLPGGLDLKLSGLRYDVKELGDDYALVSIEDGQYKLSYDPAKLPKRLKAMGRAIGDAQTWTGDVRSLSDDRLGELAGLGVMGVRYDGRRGDEKNFRPVLTTIRHDGRWFVTLLGNLPWPMAVITADQWSAGTKKWQEELGDAQYDRVAKPGEPISGKTPAEALRNIARAISAQDADRLLRNFPSDQVAALRPFTAQVEHYFSEGPLDTASRCEDASGQTVSCGGHARRAASLSAVVTTANLRTEDLDGSLVRVNVRNLEFTAVYADGGHTDSADVRLANGCATVLTGDDENDGCLSETASRTGIRDFTLVMRKMDGGYQVDPVASAADYALTMLKHGSTAGFEDLLYNLCQDVARHYNRCNSYAD